MELDAEDCECSKSSSNAQRDSLIRAPLEVLSQDAGFLILSTIDTFDWIISVIGWGQERSWELPNVQREQNFYLARNH
jgi:hypothetical protein